MAFVPGFHHDVFVSYAHGDDRDWINRFLDRLTPVLSRLLPGADVWIDNNDLRKSRNFEKDIPASIESSAVLISLVSPNYIDRPYCVHHECRRFSERVAARKLKGQRFAAPEFQADLFALRWNVLLTGSKISAADSDAIRTLPSGSRVTGMPISPEAPAPERAPVSAYCPARLNARVEGSYSSGLAAFESCESVLLPPVIRAFPFGSRVAL
jgi:hypothetical protein